MSCELRGPRSGKTVSAERRAETGYFIDSISSGRSLTGAGANL
jgi:hypothetical protein